MVLLRIACRAAHGGMSVFWGSGGNVNVWLGGAGDLICDLIL